MLQHFFSRESIRQLLTYGGIGTLTAFADVMFLYFFTEVVGIWYMISAVLSYSIGLILVFVLNKFWTFRKYHGTRRQCRRFLLLMAANYLFVVAGMSVFSGVWAVPYLYAKGIIIVLQTIWNFLLYKYWIFDESVRAQVLVSERSPHV